MKRVLSIAIICSLVLGLLLGCAKNEEIVVNDQIVQVEGDDILNEDDAGEQEENLEQTEQDNTEQQEENQEPAQEETKEEPKEEPKEEQKEEPKKEETTKPQTKPETTKPETKPETQPEVKPQTKPTKPYYIKVNRQANCVTIYAPDENGEYTVPVKAMVCSVGKNAGSTPLGVFKTSDMYTWRYLYGNQYGQYAIRIVGSIMFHSVPYLKQSKDTLKTDYYNKLGTADSMGCIRLACVDIKWIYDNCPKGTVVEIYDDPNPGPLGKPTAIKIDVNSPYATWDPTDPDPKNPWKSQPPTIEGVAEQTVDCGTTVDLLAGVSAKDYAGKAVDVVVSGTVDFNVPGVYTVTYQATDSNGKTTSVSTTVTVLEVVKPEPTPEPEEIPEEAPDNNQTTEEE